MAPVRVPGPAESEKLRHFYNTFGTVRFKKGEIIFLAATEPQHAYAIKSGFVRSFSYTNTDEERSISLVLKDELFPVSWIYNKSTSALFNYIAHTDCELYRVDREKFHEFLATEPQLAQVLLVHSMNDSITKMLGIHALKQATAEHKVLHTFNYFCISYGKPTLKNLVALRVPLTQKDIASFTGLTRETVTNIIIDLKKRNVVTVKRRYYTVDVVRLRDLLDIDIETPTLE